MNDDKRTAYEALYAALTQLARVAAPFLPFLAESVHAALGGQRSVHLEDWPAARPEWRNEAIAEEMRAIRVAVRLARSVREEHKLKHRHPLRTVAIAGLPPAAIEHNRELLLEELNVKEVLAIEHPEREVARVVKLDYTRLGKRLRGDVKKVQAAIDAGDYRLDDGKLVAGGHALEPEDFNFRFEAREAGKGVAAEGRIVVVLALESDPELIAEGQMRDLNRGLQDLRKKARLAYADRVAVSVAASDALWQVVERHRAWLGEQVLATSIARALERPLASEEIEVGDEKVTIALARA
jgi:isoleucyl-tRNA synthetase